MVNSVVSECPLLFKAGLDCRPFGIFYLFPASRIPISGYILCLAMRVSENGRLLNAPVPPQKYPISAYFVSNKHVQQSMNRKSTPFDHGFCTANHKRPKSRNLGDALEKVRPELQQCFGMERFRSFGSWAAWRGLFKIWVRLFLRQFDKVGEGSG